MQKKNPLDHVFGLSMNENYISYYIFALIIFLVILHLKRTHFADLLTFFLFILL